jgi:hypothetical protein
VETLTHYQEIIKRILRERAALLKRASSDSAGDVDDQLILDDVHGHYLLMRLGWEKDRRVHGTMVHVRLHNGKFWIEQDWTEEGIATDLLNAGVPREDIVLGFQPPQMRRFTEFAVA